MFDGLLGRKFYSKCKSSIKVTMTRIEAIRRKRKAMQKYLKNDIADLLKNGLDINAHGRAEGLLVELNLSSCYDFIEQFCGCISNHLSAMQKQRECPEECKEAVPSLMFAAARFADLPELRDLRNLFTERYGNSLESFVNLEFVEKLKSKPPTKDMKLQIMRDIAQESSIEWDSKAWEQKLYNPPALEQERPKEFGSLNDTTDDGYKLHISRDEAVPKRDKQDAGNKHSNVREHTASKRDERNLSSHGKQEVTDDGFKLHSSRENVVQRDNQDFLSHKRPEFAPSKDVQEASVDQNGRHYCSNSVRSVSEDEGDNRKPFYNRVIPPPYVKPQAGKYRTSLEAPPAGSNCNEAPTDFPMQNKGDANYMPESIQTRSDRVEQRVGSRELNGHVDVEESHHLDGSVGEAKPKPRSVRRRPLKPPPGRDNVGSVEGDGVVKINSRGMRQEDTKRGLQNLNEDDHDKRDEEERIMDRLLIHYSTKPLPSEPGKEKVLLKPPPPQQAAADIGKASRSRSTDGSNLKSELVAPPARAMSLPPEPTTPTEATKGHARATSFQPDMLNPAGHVHPKLPDYDDLAARFAALRGR